MPDLYNEHSFFKLYTKEYNCSYDDMADELGQIAIIDNITLETSWNRFVLAKQEIDIHFNKWETG